MNNYLVGISQYLFFFFLLTVWPYGRWYLLDQITHLMKKVYLYIMLVSALKSVCYLHQISTPYIGVFLLFVKFPDQYPAKPPEIRFHTPVRNLSTLLGHIID